MEDIIDLLNEKNDYLEKFYSLNEQELKRIESGDFEQLEHFYKSRECLLDLVNVLDVKLKEAKFAEINPEALESHSKREIIRALDYKSDLVTKILSQDLQVLSFIEAEKSKVIKELSQVRSAKKAVKSYRSGQRKANFEEEA